MYTSVESANRIKQAGVARSMGFDYMRDEINTHINQESVARSYNYFYMREKYYGDMLTATVKPTIENTTNNQTANLTGAMATHMEEFAEDRAWNELQELHEAVQ